MSIARYVRWQDGEMWLGYFEEFPDYLTQGESVPELEENSVISTATSRVVKFPASAESPS